MNGPGTRRRRGWSAIAALGAALIAVACGRLHAHTDEPSPAPVDPARLGWDATLREVRFRFAHGEYALADSALTAYRNRYPGSDGAVEALYWRALARLDLSAPTTGVRQALADLDAYRAADPTSTPAPPHAVVEGGDSARVRQVPLEHAAEAVALRRALVQLDSLRAALAYERSSLAAAAPPAPPAGMVPRDSLRVRDEELARARADAAAAQAELERVRRRLAAPARRP